MTLRAPARLKGGGTAALSGSVTPPREGVAVEVAARAKRSRTLRTTTAADGTYALRVPIGETTVLRATAEGVGSQSLTVTVRSTVTLALRRTRSGGAVVRGRVRPKLPGRVLLLRTDSAAPSATTRPRRGRYVKRLRSLRPGRYQAVFIPSGDRAVRSTSKTGVIR